MDAYLCNGEPQLLGGHLGERRARARADILGAGHHVGAAVGVELDPRIAGWAAAAAPLVGRDADAASLRAIVTAIPGVLPVIAPAKPIGRRAVAAPQALGLRIRLVTLLIAFRVVL